MNPRSFRQLPAASGRAGVAHGEAGREAASDEACGPPHEHPGTGSARSKAEAGTLLEAALTRENLQAAWKRVKANKGAAGVDGQGIERTAQNCCARVGRRPAHSDGPVPPRRPAPRWPAIDQRSHACPWARRRATASRCGSSQPLAQPGRAVAPALGRPTDVHRRAAPAQFSADVSCAHRYAVLGQRQRNELAAAGLGGRKRCATSARRLDGTPPLVDQVRIQPERERDLGHRRTGLRACNQYPRIQLLTVPPA